MVLVLVKEHTVVKSWDLLISQTRTVFSPQGDGPTPFSSVLAEPQAHSGLLGVLSWGDAQYLPAPPTSSKGRGCPWGYMKSDYLEHLGSFQSHGVVEESTFRCQSDYVPSAGSRAVHGSQTGWRQMAKAYENTSRLGTLQNHTPT